MVQPWRNLKVNARRATLPQRYSEKQATLMIRSSMHFRQDTCSLQRPEAVHFGKHDITESDIVTALKLDLGNLDPFWDVEPQMSVSSCGTSAESSPFSLDQANFGCSLRRYERTASSPPTFNVVADESHERKISCTAKIIVKHSEHFAHRDTKQKSINALLSSHPLPALTRARWQRRAKRPWVLTVVTNIVLMVAIILKPGLVGNFTYHQASTATGANFLLAALGKQEHVINCLLRIACALPHWTPLCIRRQVAHLFTHGGLHAGCGISAFIWYVYFTVLLVRQFEGTYLESAALGPTTAMILAVLLLVLVTSLPGVRPRWPLQWELAHRYGGWTAISLSWAQTFIMVVAEARREQESVPYELIQAPTFFILTAISICIIYPWLRLRRRRFESEVLSNHAVRLWFGDRRLSMCAEFKVSHAPLIENHNLATIPNSDKQHGYSIIISKTSAWAEGLVRNPPKHIWTRGAPSTNVLRIATVFRLVVLVAIGPGIEPCLSFLQANPDHPIRVIWSARSPEYTYGREVLSTILMADPEAFIVDAAKTDHLDLTALAYALYRETGAEALFTSNANLLTDMDDRGIPTFGLLH